MMLAAVGRTIALHVLGPFRIIHSYKLLILCLFLTQHLCNVHGDERSC